MPNPYAQVALTYVRRIHSIKLLWLLFGIHILFILFCLTYLYIFIPGLGMISLCGFACPITCLVSHIKNQFLGANVHLIPNYRRVHARVAVTMMLICKVLLPLSLSLLAGIRSASLAAGFTIVFSTVLWISLGKRFTVFVISLVFLAFWAKSGRTYWMEFFSGDHEWQASMFSFFGLASSSWGLFRLFHMTEGNPAYQGRETWAQQAAKTVIFKAPTRVALPELAGECPRALEGKKGVRKEWHSRFGHRFSLRHLFH